MRKILIGVAIFLFATNSCTVVDEDLMDLMLEIKNQNKELLEEIKSLQIKSDSLINELKKGAAKQDALMVQVTALQGQITEILSQLGKLNEQLSIQGADIVSIKEQIGVLQEQYQQIIAQLEQLQQLSKILAELELLKGQLSQLGEKQDELLEMVFQNQQELQTIKNLIEFIKSQTVLNQEKLSEVTIKLGEQGADIKTLLEQYKSIEEQLQQLVKLGQILEEIQSLKTELSEWEQKYQQILSGLGQNQEAINALKAQVTGLQTELNGKLAEIMALLNALIKDGTDKDSILEKLAELKSAIEEIKKKLDQLIQGKSPIPKNGLIAWYPFNGNAKDESGNNNDGIIIGASLTTDRFNIENSSFSFRGYGFNDHIRIPYSESLSNQSSFSFSLYFFLEDGILMNGNGGQGGEVQTGALLTREGDGIGTKPGFFSEVKIINGQPRTGYYFTEGCCSARIYQDNILNFTVPAIPLKKWVHLVVTVSSTEYKMYINGELKLTRGLDSDLKVLNNLDYYIGIYGSGREISPSWYPFLGKIDDIAIWNRSLTSEEILKIFKGDGF
jgi:uncharacterized coiled-coil DUF342 family protein